ncbi:SIA1 [Candida jiufengensis]|uniref:SIA1 n=1 Tax=Candida jiufengensis TaxID=497108 RepID=UPI002225A122|nr:SIA1 [Candida jiufengensis]KAI5956470.1 SIA1 [Candida jiufengensis]
MMINRHYLKLLVTITLSFLILFFYIILQQIKPNIISQDALLVDQMHLYEFLNGEKQIISDLEIFKCRKFSQKCDENIPNEFILLRPPLNYHYPKSNKDFYKFDYYLGVKFAKIDGSSQYLENLSLIKKDGYKEVTLDDFTIYKKVLVTNAGKPLPDDVSIIRSMDILFGSNDFIDSRPNHEALHLSDDNSINPIISFERVTKNEIKASVKIMKQIDQVKNDNTINTDKEKYKVLQLSDLHFGQDLGRCSNNKDNTNSEDRQKNNCKSDLRTTKFVEKVISKENPDLIVITGDLIDVKRMIDYKSILLKSLQPILNSQIKFLYTFGDENLSTETKKLIIKFLSTLPNCLNTPITEPNLIHGLTNYNYQVINEKYPNQVSSITVLDSQGHFIDESQINYLYRLNNIHQDSVYKLLFFHHPIPQFRPEGTFKIIGSYNEKHALDTKTNMKFHDDIINCKYNVVAVGHEHENDACILSEQVKKADEMKSIWLCYNSVTGDSGRTVINENYVRKMRLFEIDYEQKRILSWKRKEDDKAIFEPQLIFKK